MILASRSGNDILLTFSLPEPAGFSGYRLERMRESGEWLPWNGSQFKVSSSPVLLSGGRFCDFDTSDGLYQYRVQAVGDSTSAWEYSDWVRVGLDRRGWTFGNYAPPQGLYGDVLTEDDLRYTYLWGVDFRASNGDTFSDAQVRHAITSAVSEIARALKIAIKKSRIKCQPTASLVRGADYDEAEDPYTYRHDRWARVGRIILRKRPVIDVSRFELYSVADQRVIDMLSWVRLDHRKGVISFFPKAGSSEFRVAPSVFALGSSSRIHDYPHGYKIDYVAGFEDSSMIPDDLREIIAKVAACKLLNIIGDGLIAGFSSASLSLDGVSESFSSTQSATNAYFGARIQVYLKDIEDYLNNNRSKFGVMTIGSI